MSPLRVHSEAEADVVFIPIYADIGCRLAQEKATDLAAWRSAVDKCVLGPNHSALCMGSAGSWPASETPRHDTLAVTNARLSETATCGELMRVVRGRAVAQVLGRLPGTLSHRQD